MINGYERRIMQLRNIKSPYFDEAYFVMRDDCEHFIESEVLCEAERILGKAKISKRKKWALGRLFYFLVPWFCICKVGVINTIHTCLD